MPRRDGTGPMGAGINDWKRIRALHRCWIADAKYADAHAEVFVGTDITVDEWFDFWIENIVGDLAPNTLRNYRDRYKRTPAGDRQDQTDRCEAYALQEGIH